MSRRPLRIGLTGGIGSGKSMVAQRLRDLGAAVVDADAIAREVTAPGGPAYAAIVRAFGRSVLRRDGSLDRKALAARVFADEAARRQLNALTHPHIRQRMAEEAARLASTPGLGVIVFDIPLLLETTDGSDLGLEGVVVVTAADALRIARLTARDGLTPSDARRRLDAQMPLAQKVARADWVIDNNGSAEQTREQVLTLWEALLARSRAN
jgi:dephospho-CoA kinase